MAIEVSKVRFFLHQHEYLNDMLQKWGMENANPVNTISLPVWTECTSVLAPKDVNLAQKLTGGLLWMSNRTRSDTSYAVSQMSSNCANNPDYIMKTGKNVLRYLAGTREYGLEFKINLDQLEGPPEGFTWPASGSTWPAVGSTGPA